MFARNVVVLLLFFSFFLFSITLRGREWKNIIFTRNKNRFTVSRRYGARAYLQTLIYFKTIRVNYVSYAPITVSYDYYFSPLPHTLRGS